MAREVEEGINHYTTEIRKKSNEISDDIMRLTENSSNISLCFTLELPRLNETKFFDLYSGVLQNYRKKGNDNENSSSRNTIRWITTIDKKDEISLIRILLGLGMQIRHSKFLTPKKYCNYSLSN